MTTTTDYIKEFREKFANPDPFSSRGQFRPELAGKLYQEFESFLSKALEQQREEIVGDIIKKVSLMSPGKNTPLKYQIGWNAGLSLLRSYLASLSPQEEIVKQIEKEPIPLVRYVCLANDFIMHKTGDYWNNLSEPVEVTVRKLSPQEDSSNSTLSPLKEDLPDIHPTACECRVCKGGRDE